jgi:glycosyltransferase involved in cell wall biosynthesis
MAEWQPAEDRGQQPSGSAGAVSGPAASPQGAADGVSAAEGLELSVVMPCLDEAETLEGCIDVARQALQEHGICGEIVVADNGSTDGSQAIALRKQVRLVHVEQKGYGSALMGGIAAGRGQYVIVGDADGSYDFLEIPRLLQQLRDGNDLVLGNRFQGRIQPGAMPLLHRYLGNPVLSGIGRLFFGSSCGDFHCGLRGFRREAVLRLDLQTTGMEFASEMVVKAMLHGLRIAQIPTTLSRAGRSHPPHLRSWRDGWRHLRFMLLFCPRWLFLYPGLALILIGVLVMAWLMPGPRTVGRLTLDVHTLLYALLAVLIGFQAVLFSVMSRVFAMTTGLVPETPFWGRLFRCVTLEWGLLCGTVLLLGGLVGSLAAVGTWANQSFSQLDPSRSLRLVIPSAGALALGFQIVLSSFFLSILGLKRRSTGVGP